MSDTTMIADEAKDATMLRVWEAWACKEGNDGAAALFARVADRLARMDADDGQGLDDQTLAWMDAHALKCRVPYNEMTPDEARKVTAFAAMWFVPALTEVHRLRALLRPSPPTT